MTTFTKFNDYPVQLGKGTHHWHAAGDTFKVYLTNNAPDVVADVKKADLAGITEGAGFGYDPADIQNDLTESPAGTAKVTAVDVVWTASGGNFGPFRYAVIYNDTDGNDALVGYVDYGSAITVTDGGSFTANFGASLLTIT